ATVVDVLKENGKITGIKAKIDSKTFEIKSKIVIAADGVESKIARMAGLDTKNRAQDIDSGFQYEMAGLEFKNPHRIYLYFGTSIAPRGYIWIFPKGKTVANVGIGIAGDNKKTAKEYLDEWIETQPNIKKGSIIEVNSGGIPVGGLLKKMTLDNFMVVGDAAHQVNPMHGGGIEEAIIAGEIAAQVAIKAINSGDTSDKTLQEYNGIWWKIRGKNLEKIKKYRNLVEKLTDKDMNILAGAISGTALIDFALGNGETVVKILMKNPKLFKLARHII
ncbi:MAG: NAD(P)/FAD-dependent oxidoreductase, partial [Candidatus Aenigmarchaeota archaeon]|nr:NAD(P)/FAD-dependent oxidoreductase [Candidatus Aenigmarchaeota archaeon]